MNRHSAESAICPSARCKEGAELIGVRQDDGTVAILPLALPVDRSFIENAKVVEEDPEQRFRFAGKCVECGCRQWTGKSCRIADEMVQHLSDIAVANDLPSCSIRPRCRWYMQSGPDACKICPYVITKITQEEADTFFAGDLK